MPTSLADKPFQQVLLEQPFYDPAHGPVDNLFANLAAAQQRVYRRREAQANARRYAAVWRELEAKQRRAGQAARQPAAKLAGVLERPAEWFAAGQRALGGPNALTKALLGAALGAGAGYVGGTVADTILPRSVFEPKKRLRRSLGLLGGLLGAAPGLWHGSVAMRNPEATGGGLQAWLSPWPDKAAALHKFASWAERGGSAFVPTIPVDAFNQAVWNDVGGAPNPFGTKSTWGSNDQALGTPPPVAATVTGLVSGAAAARGGAEHVSPWDVGMTAALSGGVGAGAGLLIGKTLGALAGLRPEQQATLQQAGLWGGILTGILGRLL